MNTKAFLSNSSRLRCSCLISAACLLVTWPSNANKADASFPTLSQPGIPNESTAVSSSSCVKSKTKYGNEIINPICSNWDYRSLIKPHGDLTYYFQASPGGGLNREITVLPHCHYHHCLLAWPQFDLCPKDLHHHHHCPCRDLQMPRLSLCQALPLHPA